MTSCDVPYAENGYLLSNKALLEGAKVVLPVLNDRVLLLLHHAVKSLCFVHQQPMSVLGYASSKTWIGQQTHKMMQ